MNSEIDSNQKIEPNEKPKNIEAISKSEIAIGFTATIVLFTILSYFITSDESFGQWQYLADQSNNLNTAAEEMNDYHIQFLLNQPELFKIYLSKTLRSLSPDIDGNLSELDLEHMTSSHHVTHGRNLVIALSRVNPGFLANTSSLSELYRDTSTSSLGHRLADLGLTSDYIDEFLQVLISSGNIFDDYITGTTIEEINLESYGFNPATLSQINQVDGLDISPTTEGDDSEFEKVEMMLMYMVHVLSRSLALDAKALSAAALSSGLLIGGKFGLSALTSIMIGTFAAYKRKITKATQRYISEEDYKSRVRLNTYGDEVKQVKKAKIIGKPLGWRRKRLEDKLLENNIIESSPSEAQKEEEQ